MIFPWFPTLHKPCEVFPLTAVWDRVLFMVCCMNTWSLSSGPVQTEVLQSHLCLHWITQAMERICTDLRKTRSILSCIYFAANVLVYNSLLLITGFKQMFLLPSVLWIIEQCQWKTFLSDDILILNLKWGSLSTYKSSPQVCICKDMDSLSIPKDHSTAKQLIRRND